MFYLFDFFFHLMLVQKFNQIEDGCCTGNFGVARSLDGINFEIVTMNEEAYYPTVDCNAILVDDDGNAYLNK